MLFEKTKGKTEDSMVPDMKEVTFWEEEPLAESICEAVSSVSQSACWSHSASPSYWM